jgi:hypothetical protein
MTKHQKMPWGAGSIQLRGNLYWAIYYDAYGQQIQKAVGSDWNEAVRRLAALSLVRVRGEVALLEALADGRAKVPPPTLHKDVSHAHRPKAAGGQGHAPTLRKGRAETTTKGTKK